MSALRASSSTPRTSFTSVRETAVQELTRRIAKAVDNTTAGFDNDNEDDADAHCFLPRTDLMMILDQLALQRLIRELLIVRANSASAPAVEEGDGDGVSPAHLENTIHGYVQRTIGHPSRRALLALFLYVERPSLRDLFMEWLIYAWPNFPSDDDIPLDQRILKANNFPTDCYRSILRDQNIFRPVFIRQGLHQEFGKRDRLPYIGKPNPIKDGSSGSVFSVTIARDHWEIESRGEYISGNPKGPLAVAIKVFREVQKGRSRKEATEDFWDECKILDEIRHSKIKHEMVMLDLGSITILDRANAPVSHSLLFDLATFSLEEFLNDERQAVRYRKRNVLFENLVDIVEALAYLHYNLNILHLDIKPDNILVFERESSRQDTENEDEKKLVWKLSDFGLARKKNAKARVGLGGRDSSFHESRSSEIPATRPAGLYQAPEVQQRGSSEVGRRSDVWSMGCVTLMVLAFVTGGPTEVELLRNKLTIDFQQWGGSQNLFYDRSDSFTWEVIGGHRYKYLRDFNPDIGDIPATDGPLQAAVHPFVITWSNVIHHFYARPVEQALVGDILEVIFCRVLLIQRLQRIKASDLAGEMAGFQKRWRLIEENTEDPDNFGHTQRTRDANSLRTASEDRSAQEPARALLGPVATVESSVFSAEKTLGLPTNEEETPDLSDQSTGPIVETASAHAILCLAIKSDNDSTVHNELARDGVQLLKKPCKSCKVYPIHMALHNKAYKSLKVLVRESDSAVAKLTCPESGSQTAVELACQGAGDSKALEIFLGRHDIFDVTEELFDKRRRDLNSQSREFLNELRKKSQTQSRRRYIFGTRK